MPEYHVGLNLEERFESPPAIEGVPVSIGGMIGRTRKGSIEKAIYVSSWEDFVRKCGKFYGGYALPKHIYGFFQNEGTALWISRVLTEMVYGSLSTGSVPSNNAITWTAVHPGAESNGIQVELVDPGGASQPLTITVAVTASGWLITVSLETDGGSAIISTAAQVIAAITADLDASELVTAANTSGSTGAGVMTAAVAANLTGGEGPAIADGWFRDSDNNEVAAYIAAADPGHWGRALKITTRKASTTLTAAISAGATTEAEVDSVEDIGIGDLLIFDVAGTMDYAVVHTVDATLKKVTFVSKVFGAHSIGATVETATTHAVATTIVNALANGATSAELNNAIGARKGSLIHINDGTTEVTVEVTNVSGNTIYFSAVTLGASIAAGSPATSFEFDLIVEDDTGVTETHEDLSMVANNAMNYINTRLSGKSNQSDLIEVTDQAPANTPAYLDIPLPVYQIALEYGLDGETPQDADYIGVSTPGSETGIYRFSGIKEISMIATPGVLSKLVQENGHAWCDARLHAIYIGAVTQSIDTIQEAREFRDYTLNGSTMRGTCYFPWLTIYDPETDYTVLEDISPEGWVMGVWSRVRASRGFHKAPANERIIGIQGLSTDDKTIDWDDASIALNPRGVNIIRDVPGYGIRIYGARTLLKDARPQQFIHVVATYIYNEQSILSNSLWVPFEPLNDDTVEDLLTSIGDFFYQQWNTGVFVPEDDPSKAYYAEVISRSNNLLKVKFGFNVVETAEKVVFVASNMNGTLTVEE